VAIPFSHLCARREREAAPQVTEDCMTTQRSIVRDGLVVGLIGYVAVAAFYSAFDVLAARGPLHTVNVLGQAVFRGLRDPSVLQFPVDIDREAIAMYNTLHLVIAMAIGFVVATLVSAAEQKPERRRIVTAIIVAGYVVTVIGVGTLTMPERDVLPWWSIIVANAVATAVAGAYLIVRHPGFWRRPALVAE
jgi:hypothetical protein